MLHLTPTAEPIIEINPLLDWSDIEQVARFADPLAKVTGFLTVMGIPHRVVTPNGTGGGGGGELVGVTEPAPATPQVAKPPAAAAKKAPKPAKAAAPLMPDLEQSAAEPFPDDAPEPEPVPERNDEEKKHRALALLRHVYVAPNGGADAVKKLQKAHKVAKFADVSLDDADMLLVEAEKLAREFRVNLPQVLSP